MTTEQANQLTAIYNSTVRHYGTAVLLWTNPNPTSGFATRTISVDLSNYNYAIIYAITNTGAAAVSDITKEPNHNCIFPVGKSATLYDPTGSYYRSIVISTSGVLFGNNNGTYETSFCLPQYIYGL